MSCHFEIAAKKYRECYVPQSLIFIKLYNLSSPEIHYNQIYINKAFLFFQFMRFSHETVSFLVWLTRVAQRLYYAKEHNVMLEQESVITISYILQLTVNKNNTLYKYKGPATNHYYS